MDFSSASASPLCRSPPRTRSRRWRQSRTCTAVVVVAALVITTTAWLSLVFSGTTARWCWHRLKNWEGSLHTLPWKPLSQNPNGVEEEDKDLSLEGIAPSLPLGGNRSLSEEERRRDGAGLALNHIVFGIAGSSQLWKRRKEFIRLWWRKDSSMRGHVWVEEQVDDKEWDESLPRIMISEDTSRFRYTNPTGHPSGLRIARIVLETFRLGLSDVRWFVLGDDDTIFSVDNLVDVLSKYDCNEMVYVWIGEPQSLLINGRGRYQCELLGVSNRDRCNGSSTECTPDVVKVKPEQTYRFRIASLTSLSALSFQIEGHKMTVVETDGVHVVPFVTDNLYIYSGETYSVLVTTDQNHSRNYGISITVIARKPETPNGFAILNYEPNPLDAQPLPQPPPGPLWNDTDSQRNQSLAIKGLQGYVPAPPRTADKVLHLLSTQNTVNGFKVWAVNNVSHALPDTPYLVALKLNIPDVFDPTPAPEDYDHSYDIYEIPENTNATTSTSIYRLPFNKTVDIILQNAKGMGGDSETHPWHLHGHNFWVLGFGKDKFNPATASLNLENPIMKNTVPLFPYGWTALRFRTDNPGIWLFHCHIEAHFYLGMLVLFESGSDMVTKPPQQNMGCGKTKNYINP